MKVTFLGTGAGLPSKYRNTQSFILNFTDELKEYWMFDCGESSQHKIMHTSIKPSKINKIFISHMHGDHILGLIGFLTSRSFLLNKSENPLIIYGPKGIKEYVEFNLKYTYSFLTYEIEFEEYDSNNLTIIDNDKVKVDVYKLEHTIESYGFKIAFKDQKGALNVEKLIKLGINPGPIYKEIKSSDYFYRNGEKYLTQDFLSEDKKGKVLFILPDTVYFEELNKIIQDVDILISECTYLREEEKSMAIKHKHLNILDIKNFYNCKKFDKIYLTHISSRYDKKDLINIESDINNKNIIIVNDLDEYLL